MNEWEQFHEIEYVFNALCAGIEPKQHQLRFESNRVVLSYAMNPNPTEINSYCTSTELSMADLHPALLENNPLIHTVKKNL